MLHGMKLTMVAAVAVLVALGMSSSAFAQDYVGNGQCKICHNKKEEGEQWTKWKAMGHAKAIETLNSEASKAIATKKGLAKPPAEAPECLKCHATAYDAATGKCPDKITMADGVQCESCHGPASAHTAEAKKFKSGDKAAKPAEKIVKGDEATCKKCHNEESPTWKGSFDYKASLAKIEHSNPTKKK
jgi:hypothetical protein